MKIVSRVIGSLGFVTMIIGAAGMDSDVLTIPIMLIVAGLIMIVSYAILEGLFWEYEEIE